MVVNRKVPNTHTCAGILFHPGAQFIADAFYAKSLKDNEDFKSQVNFGLMEIMVPPEAKAPDGKQQPVRHSLAEVVVALPEDKAIDVVKATIDGVDLKEISRLDKRRAVVTAAETQIEQRQGMINNMAPRLPTTLQPAIDIGTFG